MVDWMLCAKGRGSCIGIDESYCIGTRQDMIDRWPEFANETPKKPFWILNMVTGKTIQLGSLESEQTH